MITRFNRLSYVLFLSCFFGYQAGAQNLLINGDFEAAAGIPGWTLQEFVTGQPGTLVNSAQLQDFAGVEDAEDPQRQGIWLLAFNGNNGALAGQNVPINADLIQTVPATPGETYVFSGSSSFEEFYSGANSFLDPDGPNPDLESPTETRFEIAFLDGNGIVIGDPVDVDLRTIHFEPGDRVHRTASVMDTAPGNAASVRVRAYAFDMLANLPGSQQSAFLDDFSLTTTNDSTELLTNPTFAPDESGVFLGYDITTNPEDTDLVRNEGAFSNDPATGGSLGVFLRPFIGGGGDATVSQTVAAIPGGDYTFQASAAWEVNYTGAVLATGTENFIELAFLDDVGDVIGDTIRRDLLVDDGKTADGAWTQHSVMGTAPSEAVSVRVSGGAIGMVANSVNGNNQSAFLDDFVLTVATTGGLPGDYNGDGVVDAGDYVTWRDLLGSSEALANEGAGITPGMVTQEDYDFWVTQFGNSSSSLGLGNGAVPEPATYLTALLAIVGIAGWSRCKS